MGRFNWGLPEGASTSSKDIDWGIGIIHWAMIVIFVLWSVFFVFLLIRYRRRDGVPAEREEEHGILSKSLIPDVLVMVFELALIFFYALPVWSKIKSEVPAEANRVDVIAEQFAWNVHYPGADGKFGKRSPEHMHFSNPVGLDREDPAAADDVVLANELHLPVGRPTVIRLSSKDVIHSFFVPAFRMKQDAVPGMVQKLWVEPDRPGTFEISCAQLCGFAHSLMRGDVVAQSPADYQAWLAGGAPPPAPMPSSKDEDF